MTINTDLVGDDVAEIKKRMRTGMKKEVNVLFTQTLLLFHFPYELNNRTRKSSYSQLPSLINTNFILLRAMRSLFYMKRLMDHFARNNAMFLE